MTPLARIACDLCGSDDTRPVLSSDSGRALRSDRHIVETPLLKLECSRCGLVRSGRTGADAASMYRVSYEHEGLGDHVFQGPGRSVARSEVFRRWLLAAMGAHRWAEARRCLEVGSGEGHLLERMQESLPDSELMGIELGTRAAERARSRGLDVRDVELAELPEQSYDVVWSIAVLEHVPSPMRFLAEARSRLVPGGLLYLSQPTQDVVSYDLFFVDHLHHFTGEHVRRYATKAGFRELGLVVGHELMPNFSLHLFVADSDRDPDWSWHGPPSRTRCRESVAATTRALAELDRTLERLRAEERRVAVFGLGEVFALASAYSGLGEFPFVCGLEDDPDRSGLPAVPYPVLRPEAAPGRGVTDIVIATNTVFHEQLVERLAGVAELHFVLGDRNRGSGKE